MVLVYIISMLTCLMHWYIVRSSSDYAREVEDMEYRSTPMLCMSFVPLVNTLAAAFLFIHLYATLKRG